MTSSVEMPAGTKRKVFSPLWLAAPGVVLLLIFFVFPVGRVLILSIQDPQLGGLTGAYYERLIASQLYLRILGITFRLSATTTLLSLVLGYPLAYWLTLLPERKRGRYVFLVLIPFWTSYLVKSFAWILILGRTGLLNSVGKDLGLLSEPLSLLRNEFSVTLGMVHSLLPLAVMTMLPVMQKVDRQLVSAARSIGAEPSRAFWLVFFPLSMPGVAAAGLLVFVFSLGFFIVPSLLGGPQQTGLAQMIISQIQEILNWNFASALACVLLVAALLTCLIYDRIFGLSNVSGSRGGKSKSSPFLRIAGLRILRFVADLSKILTFGRSMSTLLSVYSILTIAFLILPTLIIIPIGFTSSPFLDFPPPGYGLHWFQAYFSSPIWISATLRSFGVAFATAVAATVIGGLAALALARSRSRWGAAIFGLFLAPLIVPRIVIALGLFYFFAQIGLVATNAGLVIGHTVLALPFTLVSISAALKSHDWRLDQAAATLGASRATVLRRITVPLTKGGLTAAFIFAFITSFDELTVAIFVSGGAKTTLPKQMWDDMILQLNPTLAAVSVVMLVIITVLMITSELVRRPARRH
jgi:putative spermidine/putrescine transport system permease protein